MSRKVTILGAGLVGSLLSIILRKRGYEVPIFFEHRCTHVDVPTNTVHFELTDKTQKTIQADLLFGADGAFSALRDSYTKQTRVNSDQNYLEYGYKELCILPGKNDEWLM